MATGHYVKVLFWLSVAAVSYTYVGYLVWLWLAARFFKRPLHTHPHSPSLSIIIAARNEEGALPRRIANLRCLRHDSIQLQIIIVSDGSTDGTAAILLENRPDILPIILDRHQGKAAALNEAVKMATGEILVRGPGQKNHRASRSAVG